MTHSRRFHFLVIVISIFFSISTANATDIEEGKQKSAVCQGCHGINGQSQSNYYPSLAGQRASYLEKQLKAFQSGKRTDPMMNSMAASLAKQDIKNISAYFSRQPPAKLSDNNNDNTQGKNKAARCLGCHGNKAQGRASFPRLAGQHPAYLKNQLLKFKNKKRQGGPMNALSSSLSEQDIEDISNYLGSL